MSRINEATEALRARGVTNEQVIEHLKALMQDNDPFMVIGVYFHTHQLVEFMAKTLNEFRAALDSRPAKVLHAHSCIPALQVMLGFDVLPPEKKQFLDGIAKAVNISYLGYKEIIHGGIQ